MSLAASLGAIAIDAGAAIAKALLDGRSDEEIVAIALEQAASYRTAEAIADAAAKDKFPRLRE